VSPTLFGGWAEADSLSTGAVAVRFGASAIADEIYVGTGEPNHNYDAYFGVGIRHLLAGTWTLEATNLASTGIHAIAIDPDTPSTVIAATMSGLYRRPTSGSMATWTHVASAAFTNASGEASDLVVAGSGASKRYYAAFDSDRVYSSPDGTTWTALTGLSGTGRIALAAGESDPSVVYALRQDGTLNRLSGTAFSVVPGLPGSVLFADPPSGQGWYDIAIAVDPANANTVYMGGDAYAVFKGTITGAGPGSWTFPFNPANAGTPWMDPTWVGSGIHADVHAIAFGLNAAGTAHDPSIVWVGSDGGMFSSTASGAAGTFHARNAGLAITEFAYVAQRSDTDSVVFAGAQDNGTPRMLGEEAGIDTAGGDGGGVVCDPANPYNVMRQYVAAYLDRSTDGGQTWTGIHFPPTTAATTAQTSAADTEGGNTGFVAPLAAAASGASALAAFGTNRLWLTTDWGSTWVTLPTATNPYTPATPDLAQDVIDANPVGAIAFASPTRIFAATWGGALRRYDTTTGWTSATSTPIPTTGLPTTYITALAPEGGASDNFYVTLGGAGYGHVYYWDGAAWNVAMPATVVDVPTHAIVVDPANPGIVYAGTDVGVFKGVKSGAAWSWTIFSQGLPEAAVTHLAIHADARLLRAATHGRGAWEIDIDATTEPDTDVYLRVNYNDTGRIRSGARRPWVEGHLDPTHFDATTPYRLYHWMSADIKVRRSSLGALPPLGSPPDFIDFAANIGDYVDSTQHVETADVSGTDRIFVEVHNRSHNAVPGAQVRVLLLATDASVTLPALPPGYASHIAAGDTSAAWLGSDWHFVDPAAPYRVLPGDLDVRTPQVVEYSFDFSSLGLPATHQHVCLAAFVTTPLDPLTATEPSLDLLTMGDKHVAHRNTHLVALGARPGTVPAGAGAHGTAMVVTFHNPLEETVLADLVFDRSHFPGAFGLLLPPLASIGAGEQALDGFGMVKGDRSPLHETLKEWLSRIAGHDDPCGRHRLPDRLLRRVAKLDHDHVLQAREGSRMAMVRRVRIPARGSIPAAIVLRSPDGAKAGDRYRLDVMQRQGERVVGGSTYVIAIAKPDAGGCDGLRRRSTGRRRRVLKPRRR
jgi:hypothetical protein